MVGARSAAIDISLPFVQFIETSRDGIAAAVAACNDMIEEANREWYTRSKRGGASLSCPRCEERSRESLEPQSTEKNGGAS